MYSFMELSCLTIGQSSIACDRIAAVHGSFSRIRRVALIRTPSTHRSFDANESVPKHHLSRFGRSDAFRTRTETHKAKGSPCSITERRVPELITVLGSQPASDVSHKPGGRLPLLSARPAVTVATLKRAATNFAAW